MHLTRIAAVTSVFLTSSAFAAEWWQIAGPSHDRKTTEKAPATLSPDKLKKVWQIPTNAGFSSFVTGDGRAYTVVDTQGRETAIAVDRKTGKPLWETPFAATGYRSGGERGAPGNDGGDGPRSTPVFFKNRIYVFDGRFALHALESETGKVVWQHDLMKEFGAREIVWSNAASPLIVGDHVVVAGGGSGQTFLAFRADTGEVVWKTGSDKPTHSTPVLTKIHGQEQILFMVERGLVALNPADGKELWHYPFPYRTSTAASPVVWNDIVNVAAAYGVGGGACKVVKKDGKWEAEELWRSPGNDTAAHWTTAIVHDGFLYGLYGHREFAKNAMKCIDIRTGKIQWEKPGFGPSQLIMIGDRLLATTDFGEAVLVEPKSTAYQELGRAKVIDGKVWASPAISDGQLLLRSTTQGVCVEL